MSNLKKNKSQRRVIIDGNEAASDIAYRSTSLAIIYPITPSTPMAENYESWSNKSLPNIWGEIPEVAEMQSEAGAIGAIHGSLQLGTLTTTFTASQGLLLMVPTMYKIAGELHPFVMHVAARTVAKHALSIFGDHSDVMACRQTGFAILASNSPQEAHDLALIAHAATLESSVPFMHFFDGFRTSHEINVMEKIPDDDLRQMIPQDKVDTFRANALTPDNPRIRGTAQNPDVWFQGAEAANSHYLKIPTVVRTQMKKLAKLTGRHYDLVEYVGSRDAKKVIIAMGSACETIEQTLKQIPGAGLIKIRLYRPFPIEELAATLPNSVQTIAVLDRTKESGSIGEPLYLDVVAALKETQREKIKVIGGRYGLSSKEFTPAMVKAIYDELDKKSPKQEFTVGINDDLTHLSLPYNESFTLRDKSTQCLFYGLGADGTVGANKNSIKIITAETDLFGQAYFEYDSKKSGGNTISHLRFSPQAIHAPYAVSTADFIAVHHFPLFHNLDILRNAKPGATLLINSPFDNETQLWDELPSRAQKQIQEKKLLVYFINASQIALAAGMKQRINTIMQTAFFHLAGIIPSKKAIAAIKKAIEKTYASKGAEIIEQNFSAVDCAVAGIKPLNLTDKKVRATKVVSQAKTGDVFFDSVESPIIHGEGNALKVSQLPNNGEFPTATSQHEKRAIAQSVPVWLPDKCIKCGKCVLSCPHAAIRMKGQRIQASPLDCTGCTLCASSCPVQALEMKPLLEVKAKETDKWEKFSKLPEDDRTALNPIFPQDVAKMQPLFEFPGACAGCGETSYIRLITQLFGDRMIIANATGCSSIYGGNLPTTPYTKNQAGRGPAWSNSLFENNAEYGYGQAVAAEKLRQRAIQLLERAKVAPALKTALLNNPQETEAEIAQQRQLVENLKQAAPPDLALIADALVKKSVWFLGGDGWAYDIGYGGLDHVLSLQNNVNILVLDTEVYSNTGGQQSKATPKGASAKFASGGRALAKKDLGLIAMTSGNAYVAKIALGANEIQTLIAIREAQAYPGPSLIIAYSPCIAHGFDLAKGSSQAKAAVASGHWELYRYDPRRLAEGLPPLQLDSPPASLELREYLLKEARYKALYAANPQRFEELIKQREAENQSKRKFLEHLANFKN